MANHVAGTLPYPWPFDGDLDPHRTALLRCGWQHHWADMSHDVESVVLSLARVADAVNHAGGLVIDIRHGWLTAPATAHRVGLHRVGLPLVGSVGWRLYGSHGPADGRGVTIDAAGLDACYGSRLEHHLRAAGRDRVVLGGFAAEATVDSTIRTLNDRGFECLVVRDACAPIDRHLLERALHSTTMSGGIFGAVGHTDAVVAALAESLEHAS
jgi:nicotinamidase-related amidase